MLTPETKAIIFTAAQRVPLEKRFGFYRWMIRIARAGEEADKEWN